MKMWIIAASQFGAQLAGELNESWPPPPGDRWGIVTFRNFNFPLSGSATMFQLILFNNRGPALCLTFKVHARMPMPHCWLIMVAF